jgi:hypothetical protein
MFVMGGWTVLSTAGIAFYLRFLVVMRGVHTSFNGLLGASAPRLWRRRLG